MYVRLNANIFLSIPWTSPVFTYIPERASLAFLGGEWKPQALTIEALVKQVPFPEQIWPSPHSADLTMTCNLKHSVEDHDDRPVEM